MSRELWVTFDCYGTLVDWIHSIGRLLEYITSDTYALHYFFQCEKNTVAQAGYRPYREILVKCLHQTLQRYGIRAEKAYEEAVIAAFTKPFVPRGSSPLF